MPSNSRLAVAIHTLTMLGFFKEKGISRVTSQMIAKSVNTNPVVIRNLILSLKKAGLVQSKEGKSGGLTLVKSPSDVSLLEIFLAVDDVQILATHKKPAWKQCPVGSGMKKILPTIFQEVDKAVAATLRNKTLKDLMDKIHL